jgi:hypothetical protein
LTPLRGCAVRTRTGELAVDARGAAQGPDEGAAGGRHGAGAFRIVPNCFELFRIVSNCFELIDSNCFEFQRTRRSAWRSSPPASTRSPPVPPDPRRAPPTPHPGPTQARRSRRCHPPPPSLRWVRQRTHPLHFTAPGSQLSLLCCTRCNPSHAETFLSTPAALPLRLRPPRCPTWQAEEHACALCHGGVADRERAGTSSGDAEEEGEQRLGMIALMQVPSLYCVPSPSLTPSSSPSLPLRLPHHVFHCASLTMHSTASPSPCIPLRLPPLQRSNVARVAPHARDWWRCEEAEQRDAAGDIIWSLKGNRGFNMVLKSQQGIERISIGSLQFERDFKYGPYNSIGISIGSLQLQVMRRRRCRCWTCSRACTCKRAATTCTSTAADATLTRCAR